MRARAAAAAGLLLLAGCAREEEPAAPGLRGAAALEPPRVAVGQVARLELAVVTPPGHRLVPFALPPPPPGFQVIGESRGLERREGRWVHRTRVRLRAREVGRFTWPALRAQVEAPDGSRSAVELPERPLEVVSVLPEFPGQTTPFGLRAPERGGSARALLAAALAGAAAALGGAAGAGRLRRWRARRARRAAERAAAAGRPPWEEADAALAAAEALLPDDPRAAAHLAAGALCRFVTRRFGAAACVSTTEELAAMEPPYAARSRWPGLLALLRGLDALRFPADPGPGAAARVAEALRGARRFVAEAALPEGRW